MTPIVKSKRLNKRITQQITNMEEEMDIYCNNENNSKKTNINEEYNSVKLCILYSKKIIISCICLIKFIIKISGVYILWIILHFVSSHLYIKFCVPSSFMGFIISPFMTSSPHCQGLRWIIYNGANTINNMWVILGTWLCSYLLQLGNKNDE